MYFIYGETYGRFYDTTAALVQRDFVYAFKFLLRDEEVWAQGVPVSMFRPRDDDISALDMDMRTKVMNAGIQAAVKSGYAHKMRVWQQVNLTRVKSIGLKQFQKLLHDEAGER